VHETCILLLQRSVEETAKTAQGGLRVARLNDDALDALAYDCAKAIFGPFDTEHEAHSEPAVVRAQAIIYRKLREALERKRH